MNMNPIETFGSNSILGAVDERVSPASKECRARHLSAPLELNRVKGAYVGATARHIMTEQAQKQVKPHGPQHV